VNDGESDMDEPDLEVVQASDGFSRTAAPSDNTTLTAVLDELTEAGFAGSFVPRAGGALLCTTCRETFQATELEPEQVRRLEGASDPDDEVVVIAAACPRCGAHGSMTLGYGPTASDDDAGVVADLDLAWD
jgi:hypothetical protein